MITTLTLPLFPLEFSYIENDDRWSPFVKELEPFLNELSKVTHQKFHFGHHLPFDINIVMSCDNEVEELNSAYRGKNSPTNVLSFTNIDQNQIMEGEDYHDLTLGDVILAFETIQKESEDQEKAFLNHTKHLMIHGVLHVLGHDHILPDEAEIMESLEIQILEHFKINNPYE